MLRTLGGKLSEENQYGGQRGGFASHKKLKIVQNLKIVSKLRKVKLKQICKDLDVEIEKSFGKKALVNIVCNALGISTSRAIPFNIRTPPFEVLLETPPRISFIERVPPWI